MKQCPSCSTPWEEHLNIYEFFLTQGKNKAEASKAAEMYGCTKEEPRHFGKDVVGIEVPVKYDGVSYWQCQKCEDIFDRWTMKKIKKDEHGF